MSLDTVLVAGFSRCGTTMVATMLDRAAMAQAVVRRVLGLAPTLLEPELTRRYG